MKTIALLTLILLVWILMFSIKNINSLVLIDDDANEHYARKLQEKEDKKFAMIMQEQFVENNEEDYNNEDMQSNPEVFSKSGGYKQFTEDKGKKKTQGKKVNVGNNLVNGQSQHNPNQNSQYSQNSQEVTEYNFGDNRHNNQDDGFTFHQYDESEESKGK